ncbi:MAG TPA: hypothetical protein DDX92_09050 [Flavobacteriales bacterium]|jgi:hypothetical protein|nr:hypothetical protein [Flavobacteriales bacterium]
MKTNFGDILNRILVLTTGCTALLIFFLLPFSGIAQDKQKNYDFYIGGKIGYAVGMNTQTVELKEDTFQVFGSGITFTPGEAIVPEFIFGISLSNNLDFEIGIAIFRNQSFEIQRLGSQEFEQGYSFHRTAFLFSGNYALPISDKFSIHGEIGFGYYMPSNLELSIIGLKDEIHYASSIGVHGGFGTMLDIGRFTWKTLLRYRLETYRSKQTEEDMENGNIIFDNSLNLLEASGIDITTAVYYRF